MSSMGEVEAEGREQYERFQSYEKMSDRDLAIAGNDPEDAYAENEIAARLNLDPDQTEQGLTPAAARAVDAFVVRHYPEVER